MEWNVVTYRTNPLYPYLRYVLTRRPAGRIVLCLVLLCCSGASGAGPWPPQSGSLYVLDVATDKGVEGRILVVDPTAGSVTASLATGYSPNFGLCRNPHHLYVVDG